MAAEELHMNPGARRQEAASKEKPGGASANMKGVDDPDYENITFTFRNQDQQKGSYSPPKSEAWSRPSSDSARAPPWLHTAVMSLYILLALLSIILLAWVLVNNSVMSQELLVLKRELWNVHECQGEQKQGWRRAHQTATEAKEGLRRVQSDVQAGNERLKALSAESKPQ
ncbi:mast cell-expressed membrane protein 1 [Pteronotus mesoamericanus]|uniref:mast cell-expressed membrane protein 1 n=1 Tax=Pteronotus mesoamericanus TaxID=1884717 RepID=UPI0023EBC99E|nr:mast cell-expressed membrane protein 1 [Pteronotus parnellii mesoamericanus]